MRGVDKDGHVANYVETEQIIFYRNYKSSFVQVCVHVCIHVHVCVRMCASMYMYVCVHVCIHVHACVYMCVGVLLSNTVCMYVCAL